MNFITIKETDWNRYGIRVTKRVSGHTTYRGEMFAALASDHEGELTGEWMRAWYGDECATGREARQQIAKFLGV